jgi:PKD repeat protein
MKRQLYITLLLLISCVSQAQTNVYHPLPIDSATWRFEYYDINCTNGPPCYSNDIIMKGDTTINSYQYIQYGQGAIRQDIPMKKVYYYDYNIHSESLVYDFNLLLGDTIPHTWLDNQDSTQTIFVNSIDSVFVNGQWRNRYMLSDTSSGSAQFELIEGVGNTQGLLSPFTTCYCDINLICFKGDGVLELSYPSAYTNCDNLVTITPIVQYSTSYDLIQNNFTLTVDSLTAAIASSYYWDFGDGTNSTLSTPTHHYTIDSLYNICMKIYTASGDSSTYCHIIGVDTIGNIIRTNGFSINVLITNVFQNSDETKIVVYPNPFNSQTNISFSKEMKNSTIKIFDILGKKTNEINFTGKQLTIEKGAMLEGIYFLQIVDENKNVVNRKIIIQ